MYNTISGLNKKMFFLLFKKTVLIVFHVSDFQTRTRFFVMVFYDGTGSSKISKRTYCPFEV